MNYHVVPHQPQKGRRKMDRDALVSEFCELVQIDSLSRHEAAFAEVIVGKMAELGLEARRDGAAARIDGDCDNLIFRVPASADGYPVIMINSHLDTVGDDTGIQPVVEGDEVRSAGDTILGADAKAGLTIMLAALRKLDADNLPHGELVVVFTVAEEVGLVGARALDFQMLQPRPEIAYVLDGGITPGEMTTQAPYADKIEFEVRGKAAHAGVEPEKGINSIQIAAEAIAQMKLGRLDDECTANIGKIEGGTATNIVPELTQFQGEARSHQEEKLVAQSRHMSQMVEEAAAERGATVESERERSYNGFALGPDDLVVQRGMAAAQQVGLEPRLNKGGGGSDANIFNEHGIPSVIVATGAHRPHTTDELLHIPSMVQCFEWLVAILTTD